MSLHRACCCGGLEPWPPPGEFSCSVACSIGYFPQAWNVRLRWSLRTVYQQPQGLFGDALAVEEVEFDGDLTAVIQRSDPVTFLGCEWVRGYEAPGYPQFANGSMTFAMNRFYEVLPPDPSVIRDFNTGCPSSPQQDPPWLYAPIVTPDDNRVTISLPGDDLSGEDQNSTVVIICVGAEDFPNSGWATRWGVGATIQNPFGNGLYVQEAPRISNPSDFVTSRDYPFPPNFFPRPVASLENGLLYLDELDPPALPDFPQSVFFSGLPVFDRAAPQCDVEYGHASNIGGPNSTWRFLAEAIVDLEENGPPPSNIGGFRSIDVQVSFEITPA